MNGVFPGAGPSFVSGLTRHGGAAASAGSAASAAGRAAPGAASGPGRPASGQRAPAGLRRRLPGAARSPGAAGPGGGGGGFRGGAAASAAPTRPTSSAALAYAKAHNAGTRWTLIVSSEQAAAPSVIKGESVAAMGGFTGRETVLTLATSPRSSAPGEARYFLLGSAGAGFGPFGGNNAAVSHDHVGLHEGLVLLGDLGNALYDCAGKAAAIAAAG